MTDNFNLDPESLDWEKVNGMMPVIVQNYETGKVLMFAYMNREALDKTMELGKATFFSRTKQRLWTKGEESQHYLFVKSITTDCDRDTLLLMADPVGSERRRLKPHWQLLPMMIRNLSAKLQICCSIPQYCSAPRIKS